MSVSNKSFEQAGTRKGTALSWGFAESSQFVDVAEFGDLLGYERFELTWRLPLGRNIQAGSVVTPHVWATLANGVTPSIGTAPASEFVASPAVVVQSGVLAVDAVITLIYTNENGSPTRTATVTIPAGESGGHEFYFDLEGLDAGFQSIQNITSSVALPGTVLAVIGSWLRIPLNEESITAFDESLDLDVAEFDIDVPFEAFEAGWSNDAGKLDNFDALLTEAAMFDAVPEPVEDLEEGWRLPKTTGLFTNEERRFGHEPFLDGSIQSLADDAYSITAGANDVIALRWKNGGTFANLLVTLAAGEYSLIANKILCVPGAALVDGETFTIDDGVNPLVTFEFDDNASVVETATLRAVNFTAAATTNDVRDAIVAAVAGAPALNAAAVTIPGIGIVRLESTTDGELDLTETVADVAFRTQPTIVQELHAKIDAALTVDTGSVDSPDFSSFSTPDNRIRLQTTAAGNFPMELLDPGANSAWSTLGFTPVVTTERRAEADNLTAALFDTGVQPVEDMENGWRSNENSIFAFTGGDLEAALFDSGVEAFEDFENDWVLTL